LNRRPKNTFELEALEPRVLLSADALLVSAVVTDAVAHHKPVEVHHDAAAPIQDTLAYNSSHETSGIFDGVSSQSIHTPVATDSYSGSQNTPAQNSERATQNATQTGTQTASVSSATTTKISTAAANATAPTTVSATTATAQSSKVFFGRLFKIPRRSAGNILILY